MKFEDALSALRLGEKIRHTNMQDDEYFMGCYIGFPDYYDDNGNLITESFEEKKARGMSIVKMKGDKMHPDMKHHLPCKEHMDLLNKYPFLKEKISFPTINLLLIMSNDWKIIDKIK